MLLLKKVKVVARKIELDKAVLFGVASKVLTIVAGPVTAVLIISYFSPFLQGYYYTFSSLLALQVFAEMGLGAVTQQFASHEWSKLNLNQNREICGAEDALSRLTSLFKVSFKWFLVGGLITFVGLLITGHLFFSTSDSHGVSWLMPWVLLSFLTGLDIMFVPFWSLLEGCNQVKTLYGFRFIQAVLLYITIWISITSGIGLWAVCLGSVVSISSSFIFIRLKYWKFFNQLLFTKSQGSIISWQKDIFPMQWRIAISWISGYFCFSLFTPFLFKYHGPEVAGKFGMTWSIIGALGGVATAWMYPRVPQFAIYAAQKDYTSLNKLFFKIVKIVVLILVSLSTFLWLFVYTLPYWDFKYATYLSERIISPLPFAILLVAQSLLYSSSPFSAYLRAHKTEPLMYISVLQSLLVAAFTFFLSPSYAVLGIAIGYLTAMILTVPVCILIWNKYRKIWMRERI